MLGRGVVLAPQNRDQHDAQQHVKFGVGGGQAGRPGRGVVADGQHRCTRHAWDGVLIL
jgi:hypothetical protein